MARPSREDRQPPESTTIWLNRRTRDEPTKPDASGLPIRPNGPGEQSPGLRPQADALGGEMKTCAA
jgi:hypothetical protein